MQRRSTVALVALLLAATFAFGAGSRPVATAQGGPSATAVVPNYVPGSPGIDVPVILPKAIDTAARTGNANWGLDIRLTYNSVNNDIQIVDSGRLSIKNQTVFFRDLDKQTVLIQATLAFGSTPMPGNNPSFTATATLLQP